MPAISLLGLAGSSSGVIGASGMAQWAFYKIIFDFLDREIEIFQQNLFGSAAAWVATLLLTLTTVWILLQGYQIMSGRSRESMMGFALSSLRVVFIVTAASSALVGSSNIHNLISNGIPREISELVTGEEGDPAHRIDESLATMQVAMVAIDSLAAGSDETLKEDKDKAIFLTGLGVAGPALIGGTMLMLYKIAIALFVGFAPIFILSLLFEQTKQLFSRWLFYGIGTMFSLAVLSFMVAVAMKVVLAVAGAYLLQYAIAMQTGASVGVNSAAIQQGGLGIIFTMLIVSAPPMAAMFFQGTLGNFMHYSAFGGQPGSTANAPSSSGPAGSGNSQAEENVNTHSTRTSNTDTDVSNEQIKAKNR